MSPQIVQHHPDGTITVLADKPSIIRRILNAFHGKATLSSDGRIDIDPNQPGHHKGQRWVDKNQHVIHPRGRDE
jgi:hypothetical protein